MLRSNHSCLSTTITMSDQVPQTDVSRPAALPMAHLLQRSTTNQASIDQSSNEYLDTVEEEWNKKVDSEVDTLVDGMVDLVSLASVRRLSSDVPTADWIFMHECIDR
jgi:hypothetical protein